MAGYSQTLLVGNVGRDPESRPQKDGTPECNFSVAVSRKVGKGEDRRDDTTWFRVTCRRQLAETALQTVRKGSRVMVTGRVSASGYVNPQGVPTASLEVTADSFQVLNEDEPRMMAGGAPMNDDEPLFDDQR